MALGLAVEQGRAAPALGEHVAPEALQALLEREIGPEAKDAIVTAGQQLIEKGIQEDIEKSPAAHRARE